MPVVEYLNVGSYKNELTITDIIRRERELYYIRMISDAVYAVYGRAYGACLLH